MRYYQLFEYNSSQTLTNYREPLEKRLEDDSRANAVLGSNPTPEAVLTHLEAIDPSKKKAFVLNLLKWYIDGSMRFIEDAYKATDVFPLYTKFKNRDDVPHISKLSFNEFLELGDRLGDTKSGAELNKEEELAFYKSGQAELISDTPEWKVLIPKTKEAAIYFGRNTKWCTSAVNNNMFEHYNDGPLYIILFKKENKRYQLHLKAKQYMDEQDQVITLDEGKRIFNGPMAEFQKIAVQHNGYAIRYIKNPSEDMQILAVRLNPYLLEYIENPTEDTQQLAAQEDGRAIQYINNPSEEVQKLAVQQNGYAIRHIKNPSEEVQTLAVQRNPSSLVHINPSEEVQTLAVQIDGSVIQFIDNPSEEIKKTAVNKTGHAIRHLIDPSEELQKIAVQQNGYSIRHIDNPSEELQKLAVQQNGRAIQYIKNPSEEIQRIAADNK